MLALPLRIGQMQLARKLDSVGSGRRFGRPDILALVAVVVLALALRFYGLDWDRGYSYTPHPDERAILSQVDKLSFPSLGDVAEVVEWSAIGIVSFTTGLVEPREVPRLLDAKESTWNPGWFPYGSFPLYLLHTVAAVYETWTGATLDDLRIVGRAISALADAGTVLAVYLLALRMYGRREAVLASALVALAVIHIQLSHFFAVDTILALFAVAALYFLHGVATRGRLRDSVLAGVFIGLGLATKVSLAPIYLALVAAYVLYGLSATRDRGDSSAAVGDVVRTAFVGLGAAMAASVAVLFVAQPYALLDWSQFYSDTVEQSEMVRRIRDYPYTRQYIDTTPYWYHLRQLATWGLGWPLGLVAWSGLLYAALRGMRLRSGAGYLAAGVIVPAAILLYSSSLFAILTASGIAFVALIATLPVRSTASRPAVLILAWVVPYLLIIGAFDVKFMRYLLPVTPFLVLFGARMVIALWDRVTSRPPALRVAVAAALVVLVGTTAFYAVSYTSVYRDEHPGVRMAGWLNDNAPTGSVVLMEHWEEGLPNVGRYEVRRLPLYEQDSTNKLRDLSEDLSEAGYLVFYSNRLYGTIPRLPERYPITTEYYRLLFDGGLGYELVDVETSYPRLAGVSFIDDTFGRPDLPTPPAVQTAQSASIVLDLGFADESFSVYDHPLGLVFRNARRLDADTIRRAIQDAAPVGSLDLGPAGERTLGLLLSTEEARDQREGGTWTEIVRAGSWTNDLPVLAWLLIVEGLGLIVLPISFVLFRPLSDRGYLFAKPLGLLALSLLVWLLASLRWMPFSRASIGVALLMLAGASAVVLVGRRRQILEFVRARWQIILIGEALFLLAYLSFVLVRMANPDLWHPHTGGEKPMDMAYLNAVLKSSYMPPYDPWFGGGYLNYYYMGQFMVATLIKATGIAPPVAFNLAVVMFFAFTVSGAFSIVYNLAEGTRGSQGADSSPSRRSRMARWSPVMAGVGGALFVVVLGNLDGAIQLGQGAWRVVALNSPFGAFDFWRSSRMMAPDPPGHEITEFPFFTFLFADLHAHLMALPFTLLALGLSLALVLGARETGVSHSSPLVGVLRIGLRPAEIARLAALGIVVGALRTINAWDFPTYLLIAGAAVFLAAFLRNGGLSLAVLVETALKSIMVFLVGYVVFLPFHLRYEAFFTSVEQTTNQTVLWQFLAIAGLFVFVIGSFAIVELRDSWHAPARRAARRVRGLVAVGARWPDAPVLPPGERRRISVMRTLAIGLVVVLVGFVVSLGVSGLTGSTVPFVLILGGLMLVVGARYLVAAKADSPHLAFVSLIAVVALALVLGLDVFRVEGDIDRMNSVFKFYLQVWVLMALASAYLLWRMAYTSRASLRGLGLGKKLWLAALVALIAGASVYPVLGTRARLGERFDDRPLTLDGMAYLSDTVYRDEKGNIELRADLDGIRWLRENVEGSPIVLEASTPSQYRYRWNGRISVYTGLPTVIGWQWHQEQQRWDYQWAIHERIRDVDRIYNTTDPTEALLLLRKYGVEYVYVGQLEKLYYPGGGLGKFDRDLSPHLQKVYENGHVSVYRVRQSVEGT